MNWRRPSERCEAGHCVEVASIGEASEGTYLAMRSSRDPLLQTIYTQDEFRAFVLSAKAGHYDDLI